MLTRALFAVVLMTGVSGAQTLETWSCDSVGNPFPYKQQWIISGKGIQVIGVHGTSAVWKIAQNDDKVAIGWFTTEASKGIGSYHIYVILDKQTGTLVELDDADVLGPKGSDVIPIATFVNHCNRE